MATARAQVVAEGQALASSFKAMAGRLDDASLDVDTKVRGAVEEINALSSQIALLNAKISSVSTENALHLRDERTEALKKLATFVDLQTTEDKNGSVTVSFGLGSPLVTGNESYKVGILEEPATGFARITSAGNDVTATSEGRASRRPDPHARHAAPELQHAARHAGL